MKIKALFSILSFFVINHNLFGQANFVEGYVITNDFDTIYGLIDYQQWEKNPKEIAVKEDGASDIRKYKPLQIKAFYVVDNFYESQIISVNKISSRTSELKNSSSLSLETDTVFLKLMIRGAVNLYMLNDENYKPHFFLQKDSSKLEPLVYFRYIDDVDGKKVIRENNRFRNQLIYYLSDCPDVQNKIDQLPYRADQLSRLITHYHDCTSQKYEAYADQEIHYGEFSIISGITVSKINFNESTKASYGAKNNNLINPALGIAYNSFLHRNNQKLSLYNELLYRSYRVQTYFSEVYTDSWYTYDVTFDMHYLQLTNLLRYYFAKEEFAPFINAGIANGIALKAKNFLIQKQHFNGSEETNVEVRNLDVRKYDRGLTVGLGGKYKRFSGELRYQKSKGASNYYLLKSSNHVFSTLFSYSF